MPQLSQSLILKAYNISSLLPLVLRGTRSLDSAINELRWLKEHVSEATKIRCPRTRRKELLQLCIRRSRAEPLQYLLGSQPFGELDIKCRPGVLIPRPETEAYTAHVAELLLDGKLDALLRSTGRFGEKKHTLQRVPSPRILDVCSGSGCISLLLHSLLAEKFRDTTIFGLDISPTAVNLAKQNLRRNVKSGKMLPQALGAYGGHPQVQFGICNVLSRYPIGFSYFDIIISNPPYISKSKFVTETTKSVRNYEPTLALVPSQTSSFTTGGIECEPEDVFYNRLLQLHRTHSSKLLVMEIGDEEQARRVVRMALAAFPKAGSNKIEVWRDWPDQEPQDGEATSMHIEGSSTPIPYPNVSGKSTEERSQIARSWRGMSDEAKGIRIPDIEVQIKGAGSIRTVVLFRKSGFVPTQRKPETVAKRLEDVTLSKENKMKWAKGKIGCRGGRIGRGRDI